MSEMDPLHEIYSSSTETDAQHSYLSRLSTFTRDPTKYFAKPLDISPLICARFGWTLHSQNILKCSNCDGCIYVILDDKLEPNSYKKLTLTYRKMLATCHKKDCPFRIDADRWLIGNDESTLGNENAEQGTSNVTSIINLNIPTFLVNLSRDFTPFEDCSDDGLIARDFIRLETKKIIRQYQEQLETTNTGICQYQLQYFVNISVPKEVTNHIKDCIGGLFTDSNVLQDNISVMNLIRSCILHDEDDKENNAEVICQDTVGDNNSISGLSVLLSSFGWRPCDERNEENSSLQEYIICPICMSRVPLLRATIISDKASTKRQRRDEHKSTFDCHSFTEFHLLKSHRHFCPYFNGFEDNSQPGWKVVLSSVLKGVSNSSQQLSRSEKMENIYRSIRSKLRSS